ncbi:MAG: hypothetical protein KDB02_01085 [Acidimicrobiales bacterium]|nr:hypothetical protein [Acidimicrobiales bacterium]
MESCSGAFFDAVPERDILELDLRDTLVGVWGALPPALTFGDVVAEAAGVHVHARKRGGDTKHVDRSYKMVRLHHDGRELLIEASAAVAFSISQMLGIPTAVLTCPKPDCKATHLDELMFASANHRKHQCNRCGRPFFDSAGPSVSNPLTDAHTVLGLGPRPSPTMPNRPLSLRTEEFVGVAIWPSNNAIVWTCDRPEEAGVHVHAWNELGEAVIDETYSSVMIDGHLLDEEQLRLLCAQRALAHKPADVVTQDCEHCGAALTTVASETFLQPQTQHPCEACGGTTRTRRRVFCHPLAGL